MLQVQHQRRLWRSSGCGVRVQAVIVHMQGSEVGKQRDEVETTMFVECRAQGCRARLD